tara:strand:- start:185 stop:367 length:183 start_codon:yes stop_codon:yes gene_type:complete
MPTTTKGRRRIGAKMSGQRLAFDGTKMEKRKMARHAAAKKAVSKAKTKLKAAAKAIKKRR